VQLTIDGYYKYDPETNTYHVPDGDWFINNFDVNTWLSSEITLTERSEQAATLMLKGIDWADDEHTIQFDFSISDGRLLLEKFTYHD